MMTGRIVGAGLLMSLVMAAPAQAGIFADTLGRCIVTKSTDADQGTLMRWLFAAMAANPEIAPMAKVTQAQRDELSRQYMALTERLLMSDCRAEAVAAIRNEGPGVTEAAFRVLGEAAMRGLMSGPGTGDAIKAIENFVDKEKWKALMVEAGQNVPDSP